MERVTRLVEQYARGVVTRTELNSRLIELAADLPPERIATALPPDHLADLRAEAASPPKMPEDVPRFFAMGMGIGPHDSGEAERRQRRLWYDGIWQWHRYFFRADA